MSLTAAQIPARPLAARLADDAARAGSAARRSARRDRAGADVSAPRRDSKWWGWGDPSIAPGAGRGGAGDAARAGRRAESLAARGGARRLRAAARRSRCRRRSSTRWARRTSSPAARTASATRPAAATSTWPGCAAVASMRRPTPSCCRADADAVKRVVHACADAGRCSGALRRRDQRRRRGRAAARRRTRAWSASTWRGCAASRSTAARSPPASAPACAGPRPKPSSRTHGARPRPLPAVLRVRDDRRLRRHPLGRAGLERLRALRRPGQLGAPDRPGRRPAARWRRRTRPPVRPCASWSSAPRASSA